MSLVSEQSVSNEEITGWKVALKEIHAALNKQVIFVTFQKEGHVFFFSFIWRWFPRRALVLISAVTLVIMLLTKKP